MDQLIASLVKRIRQHRQVACVPLPNMMQINILPVYSYRGCPVRHTSQVFNRRLKRVGIEIDLAVQLFNVNGGEVFHATILNNH
jgi:hypothetical protein